MQRIYAIRALSGQSESLVHSFIVVSMLDDNGTFTSLDFGRGMLRFIIDKKMKTKMPGSRRRCWLAGEANAYTGEAGQFFFKVRTEKSKTHTLQRVVRTVGSVSLQRNVSTGSR